MHGPFTCRQAPSATTANFESHKMIANAPRYQSRHNYEIALRVENALFRSSPERFQNLSVVAFYGIVELSGTVERSADRAFAVQIAERIPGVTTVVESVQVREDREFRLNERLRPQFRGRHRHTRPKFGGVDRR